MEKYFERFSEENYYTKSELKYRIEKADIEKILNNIVSLRRENCHIIPFELQEGTKFFII